MQFDDLVDDQPKTPAAPGGQHAGTSFDSLQDDSQTYGSTTGALKAAGLGAARAASFGLSDEAITRLGLMKPEELTAYKEQNPVATGAGEAAGILGAVLAPEVGLLGAASAPVKAVARVGSGITKAVLPVAEGAVGKIVGSAVAAGAGSAVEGAAYGLGQSVSEHAIGDPDALGEKLFSNVGYGAAFGGGLGAIFGAAKGAIQTKFPKFLSETDKAAIDAGDWGAMAHASDLPDSEKQGFVSALTKKKSGAAEIEAAAKELDAPVLPGMVSDNKLVQKGQSALLEGPPSYPAMRAQNIANQGFERAENAAQLALGAEEDITKANLGETLKRVVSDSVEQQAAPINELYAEIKNRYQTIPTSEKAIDQIARNIRNLEDVPFSPQARAIAESAASRLESIKTVDDIKRLRSILNQELGLGATPIEKRVTAVIADKLADFEENSIVRFADREMKTSVAKDKIMSLLDQREAANAQYTVFKDKIQRLGEALGRKRVHGAQDFLSFIDDLTPEKIADRLSTKNNSEFLNWFSKELPDGMQCISAYQKGIIREAAMKDGRLNANKVVSSVFKLPKEYREKIFSAQELSKLEHVKTYLEAFPKNFNPSNTSNSEAFRALFEHPLGAAVANARDFAIQGFLDSAVGAGDKTKAFIDGLSTIERNAAKTAKSMANGVGAIFTLKEAGTPVKGYLAMTREERRADHDETRPRVADLNANPQNMIDKLNENTQAISEFAPKTAAGVQKTMIRATEFLNSKLPGANAPKKPLSGRYQPSDAELSKWHKYFSAVERPTDVLHNVATGNLVPEQVEALSYVYPKLMNEMRFKVTDKMTDHVGKQKPIPYKTKLSLSLFLGEDLVNSLTPVNMLANQNMMATATQAKAIQDKNPSANKNDLGKMERANSFLTPLEKSAERRDA